MTMKLMIILPNEAWKLISEDKNQGVTQINICCIAPINVG